MGMLQIIPPGVTLDKVNHAKYFLIFDAKARGFTSRPKPAKTPAIPQRWRPSPMKLFVLVLCALTFTLHATEKTDWKAAATKAVITPKEPMWMAGYSSRNKPAEGTALDLYAKALALEDSHGRRMVFITLDLIGVPRPLRAHLEKRLGEAYHLPPESLLLNASHTHCGPEYRVDGKGGIFAEFNYNAVADAYGIFLEDTLFKLVGDALSQLSPAQLTYHHARCGFSMNRRLPVDGTYNNSPNPEGPVDQDVPVLRVSAPDGTIRAVLFGYACHNTTLAFYQWCGDYAGFAQAGVEAAHPGAIALFVQGCGGDQNPYPRHTIELAQMHGQSLATAVESALTATAQPVNGPLEEKLADVELDFAPVSRVDLDEQAKSTNKWMATHAKVVLTQLDQGKALTHYAYPVQVLRFGDGLTFVGLAGETVVDYSLRLKRELAGPPLWIAGYCNDVMAYIPSKRVLGEGGYEARDSMYFSTLPGPWARTLEERIIGEVHTLASGLGSH